MRSAAKYPTGSFLPPGFWRCILKICGRPARVNFRRPSMKVVIFPGRSTDEDACFEEWSMEQLRSRVHLVQELDQLADSMIAEAVQLCRQYDIQEETIYIPQKRLVLV